MNGGGALDVLCTEVDREKCSALLGILPGERPKLGLPAEADAAAATAFSERMLDIAVDLIELGTSLLAVDGSEVRPAFYFDASRAHHELSLDGSKLSDVDLMQMTVGVLQCSGYLGGAAEATFLRAERARSRPVDGAVAVLPRGGSDAQGSAG
jgi:hypothetical protein